MNKFKAGDKVRRTHISDPNFGMYVGEKYTVKGLNSRGFLVLEGIQSFLDLGWNSIYFELVEEEQVKQFDLKTQPWYIHCPTPEAFAAAQEFLFGHGITWCDGKKEVIDLNFLNSRLLINFWQGEVEPKGFMHSNVDDEDTLRNAKEIKLTFKTFVHTVEYPSIEETEQDKKLRELEETINKAQEQIRQIKGEK